MVSVRTENNESVPTGYILWLGESLNWHPFLSDFNLVSQKFEQLGFTHFKGSVAYIDPSEADDLAANDKA